MTIIEEHEERKNCENVERIVNIETGATLFTFETQQHSPVWMVFDHVLGRFFYLPNIESNRKITGREMYDAKFAITRMYHNEQRELGY